ncbi:MAG: S-methyl-5-thioribose-1-phosphate isomerase [Candidatus Bipolaricaulaceae bacterium]
MNVFRPLFWEEDHLVLLDQTRLPWEEGWLRLRTWEEVAEAIQNLRVRGAPAIGIAAAYGLALAALRPKPGHTPSQEFLEAKEGLRKTRPTAVNLFWALERMTRAFLACSKEEELFPLLLEEALRIHEEDIAANLRMAELGAALIPEGARVLTICNTGALATGGHGTALGVIRTAWTQGKLGMVYACETRPVLQGARLTAWELLREGITFRLIADFAAGLLFRRGEVDVVLVGADRIAKNGDFANKVGTYVLALLANRHGVPFYVVAPSSSFDLALPFGEAIPVEERSEAEVLEPYGCRFAPQGTRAWNPAFDLTPSELVAAFVTEKGVIRPPYERTIPATLSG